jgi:hypothetical protein
MFVNIAGPEFGDLEGHILVITLELYGLRRRGAQLHYWYSDCITSLVSFHASLIVISGYGKMEICMNMLQHMLITLQLQ